MPIRWKWDGKTVELKNDDPVTYGAAQATQPLSDITESDRAAVATGVATTERERWMALQSSPRMRREAKKNIKGFLKDWEIAGEDLNTDARIQDMIDAGYLSFDEDGVQTFAELKPWQMDALGRAADKWADTVGLWSKDGFNPDNYQPYRPYWNLQQQMNREYEARRKR